jgi:hypothetical protein
LATTADWGAAISYGGALLGLALVVGWLATRTFRSYQRTL